MRRRELFISALSSGLLMLILSGAKSTGSFPLSSGEATNPQSFMAKGTVMEFKPDGRTVVIRHEAISNYMAAMTMPFKVKDSKELAGLHRGDEISFQLQVTESESWVEQIAKIGTVSLPPIPTPATSPAIRPSHPLLDYKFTNELGQAVSLNDFRGQALAITFFYTRCPLPDYCPRLSKNFQAAQQKLESLPGVPANWHLLSVSFDTEFDSPPMLKAYGNSYQYDPKHWSFLTGPADKIGELARQANVSYQYDAGTFNHDFRTLIIDAAGHLQMVFPTSGDLSDQIVAEIIKAAAATNSPDTGNQNRQSIPFSNCGIPRGDSKPVNPAGGFQ
ncbi:MAG: SCO family protein [Verrucomicrobiota bacterium]|jgi:protein SCO1/2